MTTENETNDILDTNEAAILLKYDPATIRAHAQNKIIPAKKVAGRWRFSRSQLTAFINDNAPDKGAWFKNATTDRTDTK